MERNKKVRKLPSTPKVMAIFLLVIAIVAAAFYIFQHRVANDKNTLTDGVPGNVGENISTTPPNLDKSEVIEWYETSIATLEQRVDKMEKKANEAGDDLQEVYRNGITNMQNEVDALRLELKQVKEATEDNWDALKTKINETRVRIDEKLKNDSLDYPA